MRKGFGYYLFLVEGKYSNGVLNKKEMDVQEVFNEWKEKYYDEYGKDLPYDDSDLMIFALYYYKKINRIKSLRDTNTDIEKGKKVIK